MKEELPAQIGVTESPDGVHYRLPPRDLSAQPGLKWGLLIAAAAVLGVAFVLQVLRAPAKFDLTQVLSSLPIVLFLGCPPLIMWSFLVGHSEVAIQDGKLLATERGRLFPWTRRRTAVEVQQLTVRVPQPGAASKIGSRFCWIEARLTNGQSMAFAWGYSVDLLRPFAEELSRSLTCEVLAADETASALPATTGLVADTSSEPTPNRRPPAPLPPVEVLTSDLPAFYPRTDQPADSQAILERNPQGLTLTLPPLGLVRGSSGLFAGAVFWNGFVGLFTIGFLSSMLAGNFQWQNLWFFLFLTPFWGVGIAMALSVWHMGRRRAVLAVVSNSLMVIQEGPLGTKQAEWGRDDLADIRPGPSNMSVNKRPVLELQIHPKLGKRFGLLGGHAVAELEWVATILREALHVPEEENQTADN